MAEDFSLDEGLLIDEDLPSSPFFISSLEADEPPAPMVDAAPELCFPLVAEEAPVPNVEEDSPCLADEPPVPIEDELDCA
jgi:hypothetical protein